MENQMNICLSKIFDTIYVRDELNPDEKRAPIVPNDIGKLIDSGFSVFIQSSDHRIYSDKLYTDAGAIVTDIPWYSEKFQSRTQSMLIVGIKEIGDVGMNNLNGHHHLFFAHAFKEQTDAGYILSQFNHSNSKIYDFEYFVFPSNQKRIISMGFYAGIVGSLLGLQQFFTKKLYQTNICNLRPILNMYEIDHILYDFFNEFKSITVGIIGANGNCGTGVRYILDKYGIKYEKIGRKYDASLFPQYDIFFNCIALDPDDNLIFFDRYSQFYKQICIVDNMCD